MTKLTPDDQLIQQHTATANRLAAEYKDDWPTYKKAILAHQLKQCHIPSKQIGELFNSTPRYANQLALFATLHTDLQQFIIKTGISCVVVGLHVASLPLAKQLKILDLMKRIHHKNNKPKLFGEKLIKIFVRLYSSPHDFVPTKENVDKDKAVKMALFEKEVKPLL